ncbi:twin-arginine translocation signal domain-containing protein [Campylobacter jejuni]
MNRRNFLKFNALTLASMGVAYANPMHDMHSMHKNHYKIKPNFQNKYLLKLKK